MKKLIPLLFILSACNVNTTVLTPTPTPSPEPTPSPTPTPTPTPPPPPVPVSVNLSWDPSPDQAVTGYRIYWGLGNDVFTNHLETDASTLTCTVNGLTSGLQYEFAATAFDDSGDESVYSNRVYWISNPFLTISQTYLTLKGSTGSTFDLEETTSLSDPEWTTIDTITFDGTGQATEPITMDQPQMFFRLKGVSP